MKKALLIALVLGLGSLPAIAQVNTIVPQAPGYVGASINSQAVTAASAAQNLPGNVTAYPVLTVVNYGTKDVYVAFGGTATTAGIPVRTGKSVRMLIPAGTTQIAEICGGTDTSTVDLIQSTGVIN